MDHLYTTRALPHKPPQLIVLLKLLQLIGLLKPLVDVRSLHRPPQLIVLLQLLNEGALHKPLQLIVFLKLLDVRSRHNPPG